MLSELRSIGQAEAQTAAAPTPESPTASQEPASATVESAPEDSFAPNPDDHPEIAELKKSLVAAMHRRNSETDAKFKDFDALKRESEAFRALMANPDVADRLKGGKGQPEAASEQQGLMPSAKDIVARLPAYAKTAVQADFQEAVTSHVTGVLEALGLPGMVNMLSELVQERTETRKKEALTGLNSTVAEGLLPRAQEIARVTGMSLRQALIGLSEGKALPPTAPEQRQPDIPQTRGGSRGPAPAVTAPRNGRGQVSDAEVARELLDLDSQSANPRYAMGNIFRSS